MAIHEYEVTYSKTHVGVRDQRRTVYTEGVDSAIEETRLLIRFVFQPEVAIVQENIQENKKYYKDAKTRTNLRALFNGFDRDKSVEIYDALTTVEAYFGLDMSAELLVKILIDKIRNFDKDGVE